MRTLEAKMNVLNKLHICSGSALFSTVQLEHTVLQLSSCTDHRHKSYNTVLALRNTYLLSQLFLQGHIVYLIITLAQITRTQKFTTSEQEKPDTENMRLKLGCGQAYHRLSGSAAAVI
jgi:hypothetical protein